MTMMVTKLPLYDCHIHHFLLLVYSNNNYLSSFQRYYHIYGVRDCLWPWDVL